MMQRPFAILALLALLALAAPGWCAAEQPPATEHPFLGIQVVADKFDQGVLVSAVLPNSSASGMGIQAGDLIKSINQQTLGSMEDLQKALAGAKVGDTVTVNLERKNDKLTVSGPLQAKPPPPKPPAVEIAELSQKVKELGARKDREPSLAEMLDDIVTQLNTLEKNLPKAAEEFKKQYPNGEFTINISITISSDKSAKNPTQLGNKKPEDTSAKKPEGSQPTDPVKQIPAPLPQQKAP